MRMRTGQRYFDYDIGYLNGLLVCFVGIPYCLIIQYYIIG